MHVQNPFQINCTECIMKRQITLYVYTVLKCPLYLDQQEQIASYGIDWYGPVPEGDPNQEVQVPHTTCPISLQQFHQLTLTFGMQQIFSSNYHGVDIYEAVLGFVCTCNQ